MTDTNSGSNAAATAKLMLPGGSAELPMVITTSASFSGFMSVPSTWPDTVPLGVAGVTTVTLSGSRTPSAMPSPFASSSSLPQPSTRNGTAAKTRCFFIFPTLN